MEVGQVIADRYVLEELAGTGGMSNVYRAYDRMLERRVAIKVLHERYSHDVEYVERFRREARAIARLTHPNIVTVIDRGEWEHHQFIVFEYVGGENLKDVIERSGPLPVAEALLVVREVARGLAFAHEHGVVHRDVKPHNVLIDSEGTPKVTDFGIARSLDREDGGLTTTGTLLGTSDYLAPEQAAGHPVSAQSDQYSLGVLLYELLTGEVPYPAESLVAAAMRHLNDPVPSVRDKREVPEAVDELVRRAMQKLPEERFGSTGAFAAALDACLDRVETEDTLSDVRLPPGAQTRLEPPPVSRKPGAPVSGPPPPRRRISPLVPLVAALLIAGAVVVGAVVTLRDDGTDGNAVGGGTDGGGGGGAIRLRAVADYDPEGDGAEHPEAVGRATDGDRSTYWTTETYGSFTKGGVGIVLRASEPVGGGTLVVRSDSGGFTAEIKGSNREGGGFKTISGSETVGSSARFTLETKGDSYRYLLLWITDPGPEGRAHVNEVALR